MPTPSAPFARSLPPVVLLTAAVLAACEPSPAGPAIENDPMLAAVPAVWMDAPAAERPMPSMQALPVTEVERAVRLLQPVADAAAADAERSAATQQILRDQVRFLRRWMEAVPPSTPR